MVRGRRKFRIVNAKYHSRLDGSSTVRTGETVYGQGEPKKW